MDTLVYIHVIHIGFPRLHFCSGPNFKICLIISAQSYIKTYSVHVDLHGIHTNIRTYSPRLHLNW